MSTERPPLLDTSSLLPFGEKADIIRAYEEARAKDAELIQDLLDTLVLLREVYQSATGRMAPLGNSAFAAASSAGFKPTEP